MQGGGPVGRQSFAPQEAQAEPVLGVGISLIGSEAEPLGGFGGINGHIGATGEAAAERELGLRVALFGRGAQLRDVDSAACRLVGGGLLGGGRGFGCRIRRR